MTLLLLARRPSLLRFFKKASPLSHSIYRYCQYPNCKLFPTFPASRNILDQPKHMPFVRFLSSENNKNNDNNTSDEIENDETLIDRNINRTFEHFAEVRRNERPMESLLHSRTRKLYNTLQMQVREEIIEENKADGNTLTDEELHLKIEEKENEVIENQVKFEDYLLYHPVWTEEELNAVEITHTKPEKIVDYIAYFAVQALRFSWDMTSGL